MGSSGNPPERPERPDVARAARYALREFEEKRARYFLRELEKRARGGRPTIPGGMLDIACLIYQGALDISSEFRLRGRKGRSDSDVSEYEHLVKRFEKDFPKGLNYRGRNALRTYFANKPGDLAKEVVGKILGEDAPSDRKRNGHRAKHKARLKQIVSAEDDDDPLFRWYALGRAEALGVAVQKLGLDP